MTDPRTETVAQALSDAHSKSWGGEPLPLHALCDADYWRSLASAALASLDQTVAA